VRISKETIENRVAQYAGCFKKSFTNLKAYISLFRGHAQGFELPRCSKTHQVPPEIVRFDVTSTDNAECFTKNFTTLKGYRNVFRGHPQRFELT
jgi:hypothetical protein